VTERDFNRDGSQNVLGGEEDGAGPDVSIVASSTALRRASGEVHTRVEDPQGQDTWFEPQCRTSSKTTDLARPKRRSVCVRIIVRIKNLVDIQIRLHDSINTFSLLEDVVAGFHVELSLPIRRLLDRKALTCSNYG
jgi:hypothetical protein